MSEDESKHITELISSTGSKTLAQASQEVSTMSIMYGHPIHYTEITERLGLDDNIYGRHIIRLMGWSLTEPTAEKVSIEVE
jgi:hypothetical protein